VGITHFDDAPARDRNLGHLRSRWTLLGEAAGTRDVGLRRIQIPAGGWSTPAHEHAAEEEIFFVLSGRGLSWQAERTTEVGEGDCIVYLAMRGAHTLHALEDLDVLAFGPRLEAESLRFPRLGRSLVGSGFLESAPGWADGAPAQFLAESELGPPDLPEPGERPSTIVNLADIDTFRWDRARIASTRRDFGDIAGSRKTGFGHVDVDPGMQATPLHCHSMEEELFVVLSGEGTLLLDDEKTPVRPGTVIARPPATGQSHALCAGDSGLSYLVYGTRVPGDMCYYPTSNKISFRGLGVIGRLEPLDYWDGED
jgi:uncharacterized cupin superfamily protein